MKKLILATAILAAAGSASALEAMNEEAMSTVTGQDGLTIALDLDATADIYYIDRDGLNGDSLAGGGAAGVSGDANANAGMLVMNAVSLKSGANGLDVTVDVASNAGANAALVIGMVGDIEIAMTDGIRVAGVDAAGAGWGALNTSADPIIGALTVSVTGLNADLMIGGNLNTDGSSGSLVNLGGTIDQIQLVGLSLNDGDGCTDAACTGAAGAAGSIDLGTVTVTNIILDGTTIDVDANGLFVKMGTPATGMDIQIEDISFSNGPSIGDVAINGLNLGGTCIQITAH